jgi:tetratricopeptide (TPR) repeat protein
MGDSAVRPGSPDTLTETEKPEDAPPADREGTSASDSAAMQPSVDAQHPWLGLASFTEETRAYFYGREDEVAELVRRVQRKTLTLLFGQSGLGKTSMLRAGIVPWLRPMDYCPVYVRIDYSRESPSPAEQIKAAIFRATQESGQWTQTGVAVTGESLWEFLHHRDDILRDASGRTLIPLLIFDQFEEIFTLAQTDDFGRKRAEEFIDDLADLVENRAPKALEARIEQDESASERFDFTRSDYRILIALREDYLAHLEAFKAVMPSITQNRMRLARMTGEQALSAVVKPGGKLVSREVAESIVRFVAGGSELRNAEVEPSLLSLICRELNNTRIAKGRAEISADLLAGSHDTILAEFYERALADQPQAVRHFIEDELLTESGFRESIAEESVRKAFAAAGARPDALAALVDRRLLRIEERLDARRVELTHDVLCSVVRASRDLRHEREARDEAERKLAAQRERERATRKALVRARQIAAVCAVLAVGAAGSAVFGYLSMKRAQDAELKAQQTRQMAQSARGEAEKLIVYLLDDFYLELEPVGRLDIVAGLSKRAVDYYAALPPELRSTETDRNRALALVRYGAALRIQSRLDDAGKALSEAVDVLGKLRKQGDPSEATAIGLALGLGSQARVASSQNRKPEERALAQQAVEVLKPLMAAPAPSIPLRRAYGIALTYLGFSQVNNNQEEAAVKTLESAREAFRSIDGLRLDDLPAAVAYAEASAWQLNALQALGRMDELRKVGEEAMRVAGQVIERRPGHMSALRARGLIADSLAGAEGFDLHTRKALALADSAARDWEAIVKLDPSNQIGWNNLAAARQGTAFWSGSIGQIRESEAQWRAILAVERNVTPSAMIGFTLGISAGYLATLEADSGNRRAAEAALAESHRLTEMAVREMPKDSFGRVYVPELTGFYGFPGTGVGYGGYALPLAAGDYETLRNLARASIKRIEPLKAADEQRELDKNRLLETAYRTAAEASYQLKDYPTADAEIKRALEIRRAIPKRNLFDERDASDALMLAAMIASRMGRYSEAQQIIEPVLKFHRDLYARGKDNEDLNQHVQFAHALYVSALAAPGQKTSQLTEAAAIMDGLPEAMRRQVSNSTLRNRIAEEQKTRR